jgi:hypothetical protein
MWIYPAKTRGFTGFTIEKYGCHSPTFAWAELCQGKCLAHPPLSPPHGDVMFMGYHGKSQFDVFFGGSAINLMGFHMIS